MALISLRECNIKIHSMKKIKYGIDAPVVIRNLILIGAICLAVSLILLSLFTNPILIILGNMTFWPGIFLIIEGCLMILYGKWGKFRHRERILSLYPWQGDEMVLDVGTGLGLLMIGAAKRLTNGKSYGIDIFNTYDLSGNSLKQLKTNIELEHVEEKVIIKEENIKETHFEDDFFDVIVSNLCLHNIYEKEGRSEACKEIFRILKPGGKAIISDFRHTKAYKKNFESMGMEVHKAGPYFIDTHPPLTIIVAKKDQPKKK